VVSCISGRLKLLQLGKVDDSGKTEIQRGNVAHRPPVPIAAFTVFFTHRRGQPRIPEDVDAWLVSSHNVTDTLLLGLSLQQLMTGFALWLSYVTEYNLNPHDLHVQLATRLSALTIGSQLPIPVVLRQPAKVCHCHMSHTDKHCFLCWYEAVSFRNHNAQRCP
jgi:hypothetical protein